MDGKYNQESFRDRAFKSLKKISDTSWDYSDSLLLYIPSESNTYEVAQNVNSLYFNLVTKPEHKYLKLVSKKVASILPKTFEYVDLGPGIEHKEQLFFDEFKKLGKTFTYIPVDINDRFLKLSEKYAVAQDIKVKTLKSSFEDLPEILDLGTPRFISLTGLTFNNYAIATILSLLTNMAGKNSFIFVDTQLKEKINMIQLQKTYQEFVFGMCFEKIKLLGLNPKTDISPITVDENLRMWCSVTHSNTELEKIGIKAGDSLLVAQSLRHTRDELEAELKNFRCDYILLDQESSFISFVIKT